MTTKRKPYVREMSSTWWKKLNFYKFYMLRESTAIFALWFSIVLIYGVFSLSDGLAGLANFIAFLRNPIVFLLNIIALAAAILHTKTWFDLTPKAANIVLKSGEKLSSDVIVKAMWALTAVATLIVLAIALI